MPPGTAPASPRRAAAPAPLPALGASDGGLDAARARSRRAGDGGAPRGRAARSGAEHRRGAEPAWQRRRDGCGRRARLSARAGGGGHPRARNDVHPGLSALDAVRFGGGAGAAGTHGSGQNAGAGAVGSFVDNNFFGPTSGCSGTTGPISNTRYFGAGGGGGNESSPTLGLGSNGAGGAGGGGQGGPGPTARGAGGNGTANTGSGGGGASRYDCNGTYGAGGSGGKGIVAIRYKFQAS